jgi:hypothetical protein
MLERAGVPGKRIPFQDASSRLNLVSVDKQTAPVIPETNISTASSAERLGDPTDVLDCHEFDLEVYQFMRIAETQHLPSPQMFANQQTITPRMRAMVIDWIVDVHRKLRMHTDTLYLTVMLIDQYLTINNLEKGKFQRLACAALLIAGKNDEIRPPSLSDLVELSDNSFSVIALSRMEAALFAAVEFHVDPILPSMFLKRFLRLADPDLKLSMMGHFICESALLDSQFIGMIPSKLAAAVVCLAVTLERGANHWTEYLEDNTGYRMVDIDQIVLNLLTSVKESVVGKFQAIKRKYGNQNTCAVSAGVFPESISLN